MEFEHKISGDINSLDIERKRLVKIFDLRCHKDGKWYRLADELPDQKVFSHRFFIENSILQIIFRLHGLCRAKANYFEREWDMFTPYLYDWKEGFRSCDIYEMGFLKHEPSGYLFDFRELCKLKDYEKFIELTGYLEGYSRMGLDRV